MSETVTAPVARQLQSLLDLCARAHQRYLAEDRRFWCAHALRAVNADLRIALVAQLGRLPAPARTASEELIEHLDVWRAHWEALADELRPAADDRFVFETRLPFPRAAEATLREHLAAVADER